MRIFLLIVVMTLIFAQTASGQSPIASCEPAADTQKLLEILSIPQDAKLSQSEVRDKQLSLLRAALQTSPRDIFLHNKYQEVVAGPY